jgi:hypothetical protein
MTKGIKGKNVDTAMDKWTYGHVDIWTCGRVDMWTCGYLDVWLLSDNLFPKLLLQ